MLHSIERAAVVSIALTAVGFSGCYGSHELGSESDDRLVVDGGSRDSGPADLGPPVDSGTRDGSPRDLGVGPSACRSLTVFDRDDAAFRGWISECDGFSSMAVVARGGAFDQVARESGGAFCERTPRLVARSVRIAEDRLTYGRISPLVEVELLTVGLGVAARGDDLFVATGTEWTAFSGEYTRRDSGSLATLPLPEPGCSRRTRLLRRPTGWAAVFDTFECDIDRAQYRFYETERLVPITELQPVPPGIGGAAAWNDGVFLVGEPRPDADTSLTWIAEPGAAPRTAALEESEDAVAVAPLEDGNVLLAFVRRADEHSGTILTLAVVDSAGETLHGSETDLAEAFDLPGFRPTAVEVAATDFGSVVSVGVHRTDGRSALVVAGFDGRASLLEGGLVEHYDSPRLSVPVAAAGDRAVVSVAEVDRSVPMNTFLVGCAR